MPRIAGRLLVASPYLTDENFFRAVIYMIRHDAEGAFGLVLNRPTDQSLERAFADRLGHSPARDDSIHVGGPVEGPLMALHTVSGLGEPCGPECLVKEGQALPDELAAASPLWITADEDQLTALVDRTDVRAKFLAGYSGWGPGQLDQELERGGWLVGPPDWESVFGDTDTLWEQLVKRLGREILGKIVSSPLSDDPQWN